MYDFGLFICTCGYLYSPVVNKKVYYFHLWKTSFKNAKIYSQYLKKGGLPVLNLDLDSLWQYIIESFSKSLNPASYKAWFGPAEPVQIGRASCRERV